MQKERIISVCFVPRGVADVAATRRLWVLRFDELAEIGGFVGAWKFLFVFVAEGSFDSRLDLVFDVVLWQFHLGGKLVRAGRGLRFRS
jgi:hypothetical protein